MCRLKRNERRQQFRKLSIEPRNGCNVEARRIVHAAQHTADSLAMCAGTEVSALRRSVLEARLQFCGQTPKLRPVVELRLIDAGQLTSL